MTNAQNDSNAMNRELPLPSASSLPRKDAEMRNTPSFRQEETLEFHPQEGKKTSRTRRKMAEMLQEWYGEDGAPQAMMKYLPKGESLADALMKVAKRKIPASRLKIAEIQDHWQEIAGPMTARRASPARLYEHILYVEINHPAYRLALEAKAVKEVLLKKIQSLVGEEYCREIKFVPIGGRDPSRSINGGEAGGSPGSVQRR